MKLQQNWDLKKVSTIIENRLQGLYYNKGYFDEGISLLRISDMTENGKIDYHNMPKIKIEKKELERFRLHRGDVVVARTGGAGRSAVFERNDIDAVFAGYLIRFRFRSEIDPHFVDYFLKSPSAQAKLLGSTHGSANKNINAQDILNLDIPTPTLGVQRKIVQKLDHILGQLEEKKKAILELQTSKIKHIEILSDKTIGNIISKLMHLYSPPDSWNIQKLETICHDIQPGFAEGKKDVKDGVIHLRMNNIGTNFELNFGLIRTIEANKDQLKKYQLKQGDVVFNNTNSSRLVGKSAIFNDSKVCLYSNHLTRLRVKKEIVLPEWLLFYLRARWLNRDFERMCNKWINQAAVNNNKIRNLEIPVPKLEIQKKIIDLLSNISKSIEAIRIISESILKQEKINLNHFENLSSKILDVAFSGKLVN